GWGSGVGGRGSGLCPPIPAACFLTAALLSPPASALVCADLAAGVARAQDAPRGGAVPAAAPVLVPAHRLPLTVALRPRWPSRGTCSCVETPAQRRNGGRPHQLVAGSL